jgi:hypothetical protein
VADVVAEMKRALTARTSTSGRYLGERRLNGREAQNVLANFAALGTDAALCVQGNLTPVVRVFGAADRFVVLHGRLTGRGKLPQRRSQQTF